MWGCVVSNGITSSNVAVIQHTRGTDRQLTVASTHSA